MATPGQPTPSSEIIHLVTTFGDTVESLPPSLTRSLSDLKELDAVLSGSLQSISAKLQTLHEMMMTPPPGSSGSETVPNYTPLERLKLLKEVTDDARIFRLGGEDKIRVATSTCETIATTTSHLATLSSLLLTFLPTHLLPMLPPPSAPHGYPASNLPASAIARRQQFDFPVSRYPGQGTTTRMTGALGMVREHWDMTRPGQRLPQSAQAQANKKRTILGGPSVGSVLEAGVGSRMDTHHSVAAPPKHPNQYTKKRMQANGGGAGAGSGLVGTVAATATNAATGAYGGATLPQNNLQHHGHHSHGGNHAMHPTGMTAVDAVKMRKGGTGGVIVDVSRTNGPGTSGGASNGSMTYSGMASQEEYNAATMGMGRASSKRKLEDGSGARKKTKKGDVSPEFTPRTLPQPFGASLKPPRRTGSGARTDDDMSGGTTHHGGQHQQHTIGSAGGAVLPPLENELDLDGGEEGDEGDKTIYCICERVSFGEMIGCDGSECEREWFHLSCVGLQAIPKGKWYCPDCSRANEKKKRR